jgi:NAD(P)-dependent dehydrogenase (short-subunit alcohol dehydrogenase family)
VCKKFLARKGEKTLETQPSKSCLDAKFRYKDGARQQIMRKSLFDLVGKVAIVTGAGRGIGKSIALGLAQYGTDVVICSRSERELDQVAEEVSNFGRKALVIPADLSEMSVLDKIVGETRKALGRIDVLVNNAGSLVISPALEANEKDWDLVMSMNVKVPFFLSQKAAKVMIEQGEGGSIINVTSEVTDKVEVNLGAYCPSKAALHNVTKVLAKEWGRYNIRVNSLAPCFVDTVLNQPLFAKKEEFYFPKLKGVPLGRHSISDDLVGSAVFLASNASSYISGTSVLVDGGYTA